MSANSTATNPNLVDPAIVKLFDESANQIVAGPLDYKNFPYTEFEVENINADKMSSMSGFGPGALTIEGASYGLDYMYDGFDKTLTVRKYTKRVPYTEEFEYALAKKNQMGVIKLTKMTKGMAQALSLNWEQDWAKLFYLGAGTTFITGGDGLSLVNAAHTSTKPGLATQSNIITVGGITNPVLNSTSLKAAWQQLDRFKDNAGQLMARGTNVALVVPRQLEEDAFRLKYSDYGPDTSNLGVGQVSPLIMSKTGKNFKVLTLNHIPDAYAAYWFVVDLDRMKDQVVMAKCWEPRMRPEFESIDGVKHLLASTLFGPNPVDWRWMAGSTGANATA